MNTMEENYSSEDKRRSGDSQSKVFPAGTVKASRMIVEHDAFDLLAEE